MKRRILSILLVFVMIVGLLPTTVLTAYAATNVSGNQYISNLVDYDDLILTGDTTLFIDADVTLHSISGDYALEIQSDGEHTLTIDNPNGSAIYVKTLKSVKPSQGTVNLIIKGGDDYFAIATTGDISLDGIKLDAKGSAGIRSEEGNVTINGTNVSVVGSDGIGVVANSGSISIDSDYLFVQCAGQSGDAMWEHGIGAAKDVTIISDDATIAGLYGISSDTGNVTLNGNIVVGGQKSAVTADEGTIAMTGAVTAQSGDGYFAIAAKGNVSFDGTKLDAKGSSGIRSAEGDVTIKGTNVSVVGNDGIGVVANSGSISVDSDYLFVQCASQSGDAMWEHGIGAAKDVTIISDDATIAGLYGISSDTGNVTLNGNIVVGGQKSAVTADEGTIAMTGAVTAQSGDGYFAIAAKGNVSFDGTKLDAKGSSGIRSAEGDVTIKGTNVSVVGNDGIGVVANSGSISVDSDYLFVQCAGQSGDAMWEHGIGAAKDVTIVSDDATIAGRYGVQSDTGDISLTGTFWVGARNNAICATAGNITVNGDLTANNTDGNYYCVVSGKGDITLSNGTFNITSANNAVITHNGNICLNGDITVSSSEADSCAINAREGDIVIQGGSLNVTTGGTHALGAANGNIEITQPLQIVVPQDGRVDTNNLVNGSVIVDANGDPVSHVEIGQCISEVSVYINAPVGGEKPASSAKDVYGLPAHTSVKSIEWSVGGVPHGSEEAFVAGLNYTVKIVLKADAGYYFDFDGGETAKLNGKDATTGISNGGKELIITYTFSDCPAVIKNVELKVAAPVDGNKISYSVTDESAGYSVASDSEWVRWYESNDGVSYTLMTSGSKFVGGKYYKLEIDVKTHTGYEFALKDVGSIQPDVTATVNGYKATVSKAWEQDPSEAITVTYTFGLCNDTTIEDIKIVDVPTPVPGEKPVYTVAVSGSGYNITNKNQSNSVYEGGKYVDKYFIRNGIGWYDVTADNWIYETDAFIAGHDYQCVVYVQTDDGCEFIQDLYANPEVWPTATVNGNAATILKEGSGLTTNQQVRYTFVYEVQNVSNVSVSGIDAPVGNKTPDYTATLGNAALYEFAPYGYELVGFYWYDSEDNILSATDKFVKGETYKLEIKLVRKMDGQRVLTQFQTPVTATLNDKAVDSADVLANTTTVYIYQTYTCDSEYLIEIPSANVTVNEPVAGEKPSYEATPDDSDKYTVTINSWYAESVTRNIFGPNDAFVEGASYYVKVTFTPKAGYTFTEDTVFTINGKSVTTWGRDGQEQATFTAIENTKDYNIVVNSGTASIGAGTQIDTAKMGTTVTLTAAQAPSGKMFDKWVVTGATVADETSATTTFIMPAGEVTATATYKDIPTPTEYTVSYFPTEGSGTMVGDVVEENETFTLAACEFTAPEGYKFKAWAIGSVNGEQKQPGDQIIITADTYIYAVWELAEYTVTVTSGTASVNTATMGTTVTLTANQAPAGQEFDKWIVTGVVVADANSATTTFVMPAGNVSAEATYKDIPVVTYTVTFDGNGGTGSMDAATGVSGDYILPVCGFTAPNGKQFKAWSVGGVEKDAGATINVTANTTVTAIWENIPVVTYTVSFAANGGTGTMADATGISGEYTLPANGFTAPDGMQFKAWMVGGSEKAVGDKITVTANTTVTAIWENIPVTYYTVTFDSAGGSAVTAQTIEAGQKATKPTDPTKAGYDFKGWTLNGSAYDFNTAVNGDITLVATWEQQQVVPTVYTVTFDSNGGSAVTAQNIEAGQKATKPADPTKSGYDFKGWTLNGSAYDFNTAVNGDITLVATWEQQQVVPTTYAVSFMANGGTGTMAAVTGVSGDYTLPANGFTAPDGKQFKAWSVGGVEKAVGDKITVTADTTVTAVWETIPAGHTCDIKPVAKVEPSCTEGGKEAYYKCEGCGKFYEDALGAKEITDLAAWGNIAKNGHTESDWKSDKDNHWKECTVAACGVIIENSKAAHADANNDGKCDTCEYNVGTTTTNPNNKPSDDVQSPQTGDNSMMWLWVALLFVSGFGVVATTVIGKKKSSVK